MICRKDTKLFFLLVVLLSVFSYGYKTFIVTGDSMSPTNKNLQPVLVDKLHYKFEKPQRGDVVVFYAYDENDFLLKRVIGLPYDTVQIIEGFIYVNDYLYFDSFSHINITNGMTMHPETLEEGEYWVIGDNRDDTWHGIIYEHEIIGKLKD